MLAVAGRETPFAVLQRAAGLPEAAAAEALEELVRRHLARLVDDSFDVLHARARQAVLDGPAAADPPGALHLGLAEAIESPAGGGASPLRDRLAHHYADRSPRQGGGRTVAAGVARGTRGRAWAVAGPARPGAGPCSGACRRRPPACAASCCCSAHAACSSSAASAS
ncbi:MAG: hypothetical protein IPM99_17555 [Rubrivivax sp.]|nr:hypothetical protein [Rubrivivax sp.]